MRRPFLLIGTAAIILNLDLSGARHCGAVSVAPGACAGTDLAQAARGSAGRAVLGKL